MPRLPWLWDTMECVDWPVTDADGRTHRIRFTVRHERWLRRCTVELEGIGRFESTDIRFGPFPRLLSNPKGYQERTDRKRLVDLGPRHQRRQTHDHRRTLTATGHETPFHRGMLLSGRAAGFAAEPFEIRGVLPWHNFLCGPTAWNKADYEAYLDHAKPKASTSSVFTTTRAAANATPPTSNRWCASPTGASCRRPCSTIRSAAAGAHCRSGSRSLRSARSGARRTAPAQRPSAATAPCFRKHPTNTTATRSG